MAQTKVSDLTALTSPDGSEELLVNDGGTSKKVTIDNLLYDESIDSDHYVDGSIDNAHIADNAIDSEHYADGSIDEAHIADDAVTYAKIQNVSATDRILGRDSASAGVIEEITPANLRTMLNVEDGATADQSSADILTAIEDGVDSVHYKDGSIDNIHLADDAVDTDEIADNAVTLAKMAGGTDGNIISFDASGDPVAIATGDDGQILTSAGAGAPPAFEDAPGGGKILQHKIYTFGTSNISTNSSTYEIVGSSMSFTPTSSSSQLFFNLQHYAVIDRSNVNNAYLRIALTKDSTDPTTEGDVVAGWVCGPAYASGVDQDLDINAKTGYMDNDSTSEITFRIYHMSNDNSRRLWFHGASIDYGNASFLTISEIDSSITDSS